MLEDKRMTTVSKRCAYQEKGHFGQVGGSKRPFELETVVKQNKHTHVFLAGNRINQSCCNKQTDREWTHTLPHHQFCVAQPPFVYICVADHLAVLTINRSHKSTQTVRHARALSLRTSWDSQTENVALTRIDNFRWQRQTNARAHTFCQNSTSFQKKTPIEIGACAHACRKTKNFAPNRFLLLWVCRVRTVCVWNPPCGSRFHFQKAIKLQRIHSSSLSSSSHDHRPTDRPTDWLTAEQSNFDKTRQAHPFVSTRSELASQEFWLKMSNNLIGGVNIEFPFKPYALQIAYMNQVIQCLKHVSKPLADRLRYLLIWWWG